MTEETAPTPAPEAAPKVKRRPSWHPKTIAGAFILGQRPGDQVVREKAVKRTKQGAKVTALGIVAAVVYKLLALVGGMLEAQTVALRALPAAVAQAIKERDAVSVGDAAWVAAEVRALRQETAQHQAADAAEFAQLRGVVSGRLRCPPCPACPPCPPATLGVPAPPESAPWKPRER